MTRFDLIVTARQFPTPLNDVLSVSGTLLGASVIAFWSFVMVLAGSAGSAATGRPM